MPITSSKHFFSLKSLGAKDRGAGGQLIDVTLKDVPGLVNISFENLILNKQGLLKPIWHPNAHKIGYCTEGKGLVTLRTPEKKEIFTIEKGDIFYVPQGYVHSIQNNGDTPCVINFALNNTLPETMSFTNAIYSLSDPVFKATFNLNHGFVEGLERTKNQELITTINQAKAIPNTGSNPYKFSIESSSKVISTKGGYLQIGTKNTLPTLQGVGILGFGLTPGGVVEPHWHTNAGELVYIVKGKTRITVLAPDGSLEILEVNAEEGAFAPASHFHNIENVGRDPVEVIAFFSSAEPDYIGIGEVMGAFSNEQLAAIFNVAPGYFSALNKTEEPQIIVPL